MNTIYAIYGWKRSGKDSVANVIMDECAAKEHDNIPTHLSFAELIKTHVNTFLNSYDIKDEDKEKSVDELYPGLADEMGFDKKLTYRDFLIKYGTMARDLFGRKVFSTDVKRRINNFIQCGDIVISDVRFSHEIEMLNSIAESENINLVNILVFKKDCVPQWALDGLKVTDSYEYNRILKKYKPHASEIEWCHENPSFKFVFTNDGTLEELQEKVKQTLFQ